MRIPSLITLLILSLSTTVHAAPSTPAMGAGFEPLAFLVGEWTGTDPEGLPIRASYAFTSGGTSLSEMLTPEKSPAMTTMYILDGTHLMLTHYCSLNNQPRMRANDYMPGDRTLSFSFVDATNLKSHSDAHMHRLTFEFKDRDHFSQTWILSKDGREMPKTFHFVRVK